MSRLQVICKQFRISVGPDGGGQQAQGPTSTEVMAHANCPAKIRSGLEAAEGHMPMADDGFQQGTACSWAQHNKIAAALWFLATTVCWPASILVADSLHQAAALLPMTSLL